MSAVLYLTHRIPCPPDKGDKIRAFHLLRALASHFEVHVGTFIDDPRDWQHVDALAAYARSSCVLPLPRRWATMRSLTGLLTGEPLTDRFYADARMHAWVRRVLEKESIRTVVCYSSAMAQYAPERAGCRRVIDFVDVDSDKWRQYGERRRGPLAWVYAREARLLAAREAEIARSFDAASFVSSAEAAYFRESAPEGAGRVHVIGNGVDASFFDPCHELPDPYAGGRESLVFTGAMDYWPNIDAVVWFAREVLPLIRRSRPRAEFWIVGSNPAAQVLSLAGLDGVRVTGRVPDVRPYLKHARLCVAPLRVSRGVQNKVLEAMAMGRPVLATSAAVRGIDAAGPAGTRIADDAQGMASLAVELLGESAADALGSAARAYVRERFDWQANLDAFLRVVRGQAAA